MHRPSFLALAIIACSMVALNACISPPHGESSLPDAPRNETEPSTTTTVLLVRHAEYCEPVTKSCCDSEDPNCCDPDTDPSCRYDDRPLSKYGYARAEQLAQVASKAEVQAIYTTKTRRTSSTVQPLAQARSLDLQFYGEEPQFTYQQFANDVLEAHVGEVVVIAAHSNTVDDLIDAFGGAHEDCPIGLEFDNLCLVTIHQTGEAAVVNLQYGDPSPAHDWLQVSPRGVGFGNVGVGSTMLEPITISNRGRRPLEITEMTLSNTDAFSLFVQGVPDACGTSTPTIPSGGGCAVQIRFAPSMEREFSASLRIKSTDPPLSKSVSLWGTAMDLGEPNIWVRPTHIDFGEVPREGLAGMQWLFVRNVGTATLHAKVLLAEGFDFSVGPAGLYPCSSMRPTLDPGDGCSLGVSFKPVRLGPSDGALLVKSDDPDEGEVWVTLLGTGTD